MHKLIYRYINKYCEGISGCILYVYALTLISKIVRTTHGNCGVLSLWKPL